MPKKRSSQTAARRPSGDPAARAVDAALALAAERGWRHVTLGDIAREAKLPLGELYTLYPGRSAVLAAFARRIDGIVLADGEAEGDSARERLFEVLMRRFDALRPHKAAVEAILRDGGADPLAALCGVSGLVRSMAWMLEAAGIRSHGIRGRARARGLALLYLATMRVWLSDDSPDMSRTMASLDKRLSRAESLMGLCERLKPRPRREHEAAAAG